MSKSIERNTKNEWNVAFTHNGVRKVSGGYSTRKSAIQKASTLTNSRNIVIFHIGKKKTAYNYKQSIKKT
jgi:hypothetical protein